MNWLLRILNRLGSPAGASLAADLVTINDLVDDLESRLTALRAGYLDELDFDLNARLGSPAGASLAADLVTIDDFVDELETRLSAVRAGYLDELGPTNIPADLDTLLTRLSATRAGYLDELSSANLPTDIAALNTLLTDGTYGLAALENLVDELETRLSALRAGYLDELGPTNIPADIDAILALVDSAESVGPFSYLDAGGEQTVVEDTATTRRRISLEFSNRNMAQTGKFVIFRKVDGSNYDVWTTVTCTVSAGDDRVWDAEFVTNQQWKLNYTEDVDEGAARAIPYNIITQVIE